MPGYLRNEANISGILSSNGNLSGVLTGGCEKGGDIDPYTGDYIVIPKVVDQTMSTANKKMIKDVTIKEIPKHEVSNDYGTTLVIGGIM